MKLRKALNNGGTTKLSLTVPTKLHAVLEAMINTDFECELTEDGILFRPIAEKTELPGWVK